MALSAKISIEIGGEKLTRFSELTLNQEVNNHHNFIIKQPVPREFIDQAVEKTQGYVGKNLLVELESSFLKTGGSLLFKGIITEAKIIREFGVGSQIYIKGYSPTILLEGNPNVKSYSDKSIGDIANEVLNNYSKQQLRSTISPKNTSSLPYTVQYNESDFAFLKRLAQKKAEWLYFNGSELFLCQPKGKTFELDYGHNLHNLEIDMKAQPVGFSYLGYEPSSADTQTISSSELNHQEQGYTRSIYDASKKLYPESGTHLYSQPIGDNGAMPHLSDRVKTQLEAKTANMITVYAESDELGLRIGDTVKISEPAFSPTNNPADGIKQQNFGEYIVTKIQHHCDETGKYYNTFEAVPSSVQSPPYTHVLAHPHSGTQPATITDNNDPAGLGRVKVKFPWQNMDGTPWLRMTNPHAGGGKGMYFIPEIGEEVLIAFEDNNAEKPFVLGAMYNGSESSGYATGGNDNKVIQSRSGTKIIMNDAAGSVFVEDPSGNKWFMDGNGNISVDAPKNFTVNAGENISFTAGMNISSNATMNISQGAGANITENAGANKSTTVGAMNNIFVGGNNLMHIMGEYTEHVEGDKKSHTEQERTVTSNKGIETSSEGEINKNSKKQIQVNSAEKTNQF